MTRIACIIIATERRKRQVWERVVVSACAQGFDDVVVVGDWAQDVAWPRYLCVEPLTRTTTDALVKRDVGTLATDADILTYLCDDHVLAPNFVEALRLVAREPWDVIVPNRIVYTDHGVGGKFALNNGERDGYCGGHGGVFKRHVVTAKPWSAHAHHRNWDVLISAEQQTRGATFLWHPRAELTVTDIEPENRPWE